MVDLRRTKTRSRRSAPCLATTLARAGRIGAAEVPLEESAAQFQPLAGEGDRLGFSDRIEDQPFLVKPSEGVPVVSFPGTVIIVKRELEQGEYRLVDFVRIEVHGGILHRGGAEFNAGPLPC